MMKSNKAAGGGRDYNAHNQPGMGSHGSSTGGKVPDMGGKGSYPKHTSSNQPGLSDGGFNGDRNGG